MKYGEDMRLIKLEMEGFGPFKNREIIDFEKFGNEGILLISGKTGSGKTTIFDAISYALFDESSTGERPDSELRYVDATEDMKTKVSLEFEYKKNRYKITRSPSYIVKSNRTKNGLKKKEKTAKLELPDGSEINGITEVKNKIKQILGLEKEQFKHIAMLSQGKFSEFLKSSSDEKLKIFRKIFQSENYTKLESNIQEKLSKQKENWSLYSQENSIIIDNLLIPEEYQDEFNKLKSNNDEKFVKFIKKLNTIKSEEISEFNKNLECLNQKNEKEKILLQNVINYFDKVEKIKKINSTIESTELKYEKIELEYGQIEEKQLKIKKLNSKLEEIKKDLTLFNEVEELEKNRKNIEDKSSDSKIEILNLNKENEKNKENEDKLKRFIDENKNINEKIIHKENELEKIISSLEVIDEINKNIENKESKEKEYMRVYDLYKSKKKELSDVRNKYDEFEIAYFDSQAGILANKLKENKPCPVCGSITHPNPAIYHGDISREKLDEMKKKLEDVQNQDNDLNRKVLDLDNSIIQIKEHIQYLLKKLDIQENKFIEQTKSIKDDKEKLEEEIKLLKDVKENIENSRKKIDEIKFEMEQNDRRILDINIEIAKSDERINILSVEIEQKNNILDGKSLDILKKNEVEYNEEITDIEKNIEEIQNNYLKIREELSSFKGQKKELESQINEKYNQDVKVIESKIQKNNIDIEALMNKISYNKNLVLNNENQIEKLEINLKNLEETRKQKDDLSKLYDVLRGNFAPKIRFETFVLIRFLDQLIIATNKRFYSMTDGEFTLKRKKESDNAQTQYGLDFEIVDHYNSSVRNISSLSGGESFEASISLALGLSDIVSMNVGNIQLDSMFLDEGFGTLDQDTLDKVMNTLVKISSKNKLIGLISHVEKLKDEIQKQIIVEKKKEGYSIIQKQIY